MKEAVQQWSDFFLMEKKHELPFNF